MSTNREKFQVRRGASLATLGFTLEMIQGSRKSKRTASVRVQHDHQQHDSTPVITEHETGEPKPLSVYLYVQLQNICNLPPSANIMKLRLKDDSRITPMTGERNIDQIDLENLERAKPTFAIRIEQDSIDELNAFSDNPLRIMIYENLRRTIRKTDADGDDDAEGVEFTETYEDLLLAEGYIDLLQFFRKKRAGSGLDVFLYPKDPLEHPDTGTCKMTWQIYSLLPLLKDVTFKNVVFITFESLYNVPDEIKAIVDYLNVDIFFQSVIPDKKKKYNKIKICNFSTFVNNIIAHQNPNMRWESITDITTTSRAQSLLSTHAGMTTVPTHKLLRGLLCSEHLIPSLHDVSINNDSALSCNAIRRYVLTEELIHILEDVVAFNEQQLLLQFYHGHNPKEILLQGTLDLSIFLYPAVNACRFAVALESPQKTTARRSSSRRSSSSNRKNKHPFAVVNICLMTPITEKAIEARLNESKVETCHTIPTQPRQKNLNKVVEESYRDFDKFVKVLVDHIVTNNIKSVDGAKEFFCSHVGNMSNKILQLVKYDFNLRYPTKNNIEFQRLMTTVYKDVMARINNLLRNCSQPSVDKCLNPSIEKKIQTVRLMSVFKYLLEAKEQVLSAILLKKIQGMKQNDTRIGFYMMIHDVENQRYAEARKYFERPLIDKYSHAEYYAGLIRIYVDYMEILQNEQTFNEALQSVIRSLKAYTERFPRKIESYIMLYCFYKSCGYVPGMSFARLKYENLFGAENFQDDLPAIPKSRYGMHYRHTLTFDTLKGINLYKIACLMARLGMYKFAEMIYNDIAHEAKNELQKYILATTFRLLQKELPADHKLQYFATEHVPFPEEAAANQELCQGNANLYRQLEEAAINNYERLVFMKGLYNRNPYRLGILRYAYAMLEKTQYEKAAAAFTHVLATDCALAASYELGKIMYKLNRLEEAEEHFANATRYQIHLADVWAYLAVINLKLGNMYKALETWKYARIHPDTPISDEILQELHTLDMKDLVLYVDKPFVRRL